MRALSLEKIMLILNMQSCNFHTLKLTLDSLTLAQRYCYFLNATEWLQRIASFATEKLL